MITRSDLNNVFGSDNVSAWADLNNNGTNAEILARIEWAAGLALADVRSRIATLSYKWDEVSADAQVVHAQVLKAGLLLYGNRAVSDEENRPNPMRVHAREYENFFKDLSVGKVALTAERTCRPYPAVVPNE